ncbi:MAG: SIMPL domain-containing protein [Pseudomonadota bacterium]
MRNAIATVLAILTLGGGAVAETGPVITVTGTGSVDAAPDMAILDLGTTLRAQSSQAVLDQAGEVTASLIAALKSAEVSEDDIQTRRAALRPIFPRQDDGQIGSVPEAYEANVALAVKIRDLSAVGLIYAAASKAGATRFDGLRFQLSDPSAPMAEARAAAVADAKLRAETYAGAAGLSLDSVLSMNETGRSVGPVPFRAEMAADVSAMPIAAGTLDVSAQITIVYALTE